MSNVLIGIIGVILFIGLALAGALFLGDRFSETRNSSVGAATVQAVNQVANALNYSNVDNASRASAGTTVASLVSGRYLKSIPTNPGGTAPLAIVGAGGEASGVDASLVVAQLASGQDRLCGAVVRQTNNGSDVTGTDGYVTASSAATLPKGPAGCFKVGATSFGVFAAGEFYVFARL